MQATSPFALDTETARFNMIEQQIRPWEVADATVLALLDSVPRDQFAPVALRGLAYADVGLPLSSPAKDGESMLHPKAQARMAQDIALNANETVLHIGTGSGFSVALLAKQAKSVLTLEINPAIAKQAKENLQRAGITNVDVRQADAAADNFKACTAQGPYDAIVLSGTVAEVPQALLDLLKVGGRLFAFVGEDPVVRATVVTRASETGYATAQPWDFVAPRLVNFPTPSTFRF
ncbi:MAG: protein-L-isoaspartate O-methyltransferase [Burkholderiales bacterium]|nr:protein-L-isoaspartate O-methyltransferase [Burkholderiales bacterium]